MRKRKPKMEDMELDGEWVGCEVRVTWQDIVHIEGDVTLSEVEKEPPLFFNSYGLVVNEKDNILSLACTVSGDSRGRSLRDVVKLPRVCITKIIKLEEVK